MSDYVADTHALFWYLVDDSRLGARANDAFKEAEQGGGVIYVSAVVLAEMYYLMAKQGILPQFPALYQLIVSAPYMRVEPFRGEDVLLFDQLSPVPEMHDRIVAGVAYRLGLPCLTRDQTISGSGVVATIW